MKTVEESKIDWYNTRGGRTIVKPTLCDELTLQDIVRGVGLHGRKGAPVKKILKKKKTNPFKTLIDKGYNTTIVTVGEEKYVVSRLLANNQITKIIGHNDYKVEYIKVKLDI